MTDETIVAVYDTATHAEAAVRDLEAAGVPSSAISRHSGTATTTTTGTTAPVREKGFWANMFGGAPDHDESVYDRSLDSGSSVVTVKVANEHVDHVTSILEQHNPVDMDERAASYSAGAAGMTTTTTTTTADPRHGAPTPQTTPVKAGGEEVIALSEEQLQIGKRLVNRGTTRIRRFVVETPVEEAVTLHSEHVSVERRPIAAGTKVTNADFSDRTVEVTETDEEAVVGKTAHVKEEVVVNKTAADRVETVHDTVRHEDVEITKDGASTSTSGTTAPVSPTTPSRI